MEQDTEPQVCATRLHSDEVGEVLLHEGVDSYKKEGPKFMQRLVAKQKARVKDSDLGGHRRSLLRVLPRQRTLTVDRRRMWADRLRNLNT